MRAGKRKTKRGRIRLDEEEGETRGVKLPAISVSRVPFAPQRDCATHKKSLAVVLL
jgi:hypothetical protein